MASHHAPVPAGVGLAIPNSPNDLLKFIHTQQKQKKKAAASSASLLPNAAHGGGDRQKKQEEERELYEAKLMELEDCIFGAMGAKRLRHAEERLLM